MSDQATDWNVLFQTIGSVMRDAQLNSDEHFNAALSLFVAARDSNEDEILGKVAYASLSLFMAATQEISALKSHQESIEERLAQVEQGGSRSYRVSGGIYGAGDGNRTRTTSLEG